jgi:hypothetical protein
MGCEKGLGRRRAGLLRGGDAQQLEDSRTRGRRGGEAGADGGVLEEEARSGVWRGEARR